MATYEVGALIRLLRIQNGLSQEELCDGICSVSTLSRAELGQQLLSDAHFKAVMQRLGENASNYFNSFIGSKDYETYRKKQELEKLLIAHDYKEADKLANELDKDSSFHTGFNFQFLQAAKARIRLFVTDDDSKTEEELQDILDMLYEAIKITIKDFNEDKIKSYFLTYEEIFIINNIAVTHSKANRFKTAIKILDAVRQNINDKYLDHDEKMDMYITILYNLSKYWGLIGNHQKSLETSELGIKICKETKKLALLPFLIFNKAWALHEIGDIEPCKRLLYQSYYGLDALGDFEMAQIVKLQAQARFGLEL